jgi:hypothetical protein
MPKRKDESTTDERVSKARKLSKEEPEPEKSYANEFERILDLGKELVINELKLVQRFERQKLSRRSKTAAGEKNDKVVKRISDEIKALNGLNADEAADRHVRKVLLKIKAIETSGKLPEAFKEQKFAQLDAASANVTARLYSSLRVREAVTRLVDSLRREITKELGQNDSALTKSQPLGAPKRAKSTTVQSAADGITAGNVTNEENGVSNTVTDDTEELWAQDDAEELESAYSSGNSEDIAAESSDSENEAVERPKHVAKRKRARNISYSPSPSLSYESEPELKPQRGVRTSTFLPSLTIGGYVSGSESDASDINAELAPRKNRRGQRARQAIAERKHGTNAKHLHKTKQAKAKDGKISRDDGWDAKRGAVSHDDKVRTPKNTKDTREDAPKNSQSAEVRKVSEVARRRDDDGLIHASWQAKKIAKAKENVSIHQFAGKKIVFD